MEKCLYIFIDESGNLDFSPSGTRYFVLTSISTLSPFNKRNQLSQLRFDFLKNGEDVEFFHATEDKQHIRNQVFQVIEENLDDISIDSVIAQKNKTHSSLYQRARYDKDKQISYVNEPDEFYRIICQTLLRYILQRYKSASIDGVVIVLSSLFTEKRCKLITKTLKSYLKQFTPYPFHIYFHKSEADINSQIADYCGWAIYVKHERGEERPYQKVSVKVKSEFDIFRSGTTLWYQYN